MSPLDDDSTERGEVDDMSSFGTSRNPAQTESASVVAFLTELRSLGEGPAPAPSDELAALLGGAVPLGPVRRRRAAGWIRWTALVAAAVIAMTLVAAANHSLPRPAQRVVSNVVNTITPFHIDPPRDRARPSTPPATQPPRTKHHVRAVPVTPSPTEEGPVERASEPADERPTTPRRSTSENSPGSGGGEYPSTGSEDGPGSVSSNGEGEDARPTSAKSTSTTPNRATSRGGEDGRDTEDTSSAPTSSAEPQASTSKGNGDRGGGGEGDGN